jgi:AraC-like DNA-binding protein
MNARARRAANSELRFWRDGALDGACLASAHYRAHHFTRHVHDEMVIAVTEDGSGDCRTRMGKLTSAPDTVWVFAPGEYHCGEVRDEGHWRYRGIYLDQTGLESLARILSDEAASSLWVPPGLYYDAQLARLLVQAHRCFDENVSLLERQTRWWAAMGVLFGRYGQPRPHAEHRPASRRKLRLARDFIADHLTRNVSVDEVAEACGLTRFHLMRSFAREYGMPPHAYANQLRLLEAKRLIVAGHGPAYAATAAGFYDQSHMTRMFRRAYGLTPGAYAKLNPRRAAPG